ncbi:MAG TPA: hypothetical protein VFD70_05505 [Anaerolineae bacterium]|nr:hypothetical protein [Anaerolineae bacterium]
MTPFQLTALAILLLGILAVVIGWAWIMVWSRGRDVELTFRQIKEGWEQGKFRALVPILLAIVGLFVTMFAIALVMFAFDVPFLVTLLWFGACIYAVLQTARAFIRA